VRFGTDAAATAHRCASAAIVLTFVIAAADATVLAKNLTPKQQRYATVRDAIEATTLADRTYLLGGYPASEPAVFSPDRSSFVVVTRQGNVDTDSNLFSLRYWRVEDIDRGFATGRVLATRASSSNRDGISDVTWTPDGRAITFIGTDPDSRVTQVYVLDLESLKTTSLTAHESNVVSFSRDATTGIVAFLAEAPQRPLWPNSSGAGEFVVANEPLADLVASKAGYRFRGRDSEFELFIQKSTEKRQIDLPRMLARTPIVSLAPGSRRLVIRTQVASTAVPASWARYRFRGARRLWERTLEPGAQESYLQRYEVVDLNTGATRAILDSPAGYGGVAPLWSPTGLEVALSQTFLPLTKEAVSNFPAALTEARSMVVNVAKGGWDVLPRECASPVTWAERDHLVCTSIDGHEVAYARDGSDWNVAIDQPKPPIHTVEMLEDYSTTPRLAVRTGAAPTRTILDLNPNPTNAMVLGRVEEIQWALPDGSTHTGGLYYPPQYRKGQLYPLVIQTHAWEPRRFAFDGPWTTGYAAQPLAAQDIMVLQLQDIQIPEVFGSNGQRLEIERAISIYRSAIDALAKRGLIDRERVGAIGFSHTCLYVKYALAHTQLFAAAAIAEGEDAGYVQYVTRSNYYADVASLYGGPPFGVHLQEWLKFAPGFNLHSVQAPTRIYALKPRFLLAEWEWYAGLAALKKPVELVLLEDADHVIQRPSERVVVQGGNVDWFDFWLNGQAEADPAKVEQFRRWHALRVKQCQLFGEDPTPPWYCRR
jgi:dipeptidyl aminopeptidase/acylaminoacyl peptidase